MKFKSVNPQLAQSVRAPVRYTGCSGIVTRTEDNNPFHVEVER